MADGTVVFHDLLGSLWTTTNLSALIQQPHVEIPFDQQLDSFLNEHEVAWRTLVVEVCTYCDVPANIAEREPLYSPWRNLSSKSSIYDARGVTIEIILGLGEYSWIDIDFARHGNVQQFAKTALTPCLAQMTSRLLKTHRFFSNSQSIDRNGLDACLRPLQQILGPTWSLASVTMAQSLLDLITE